MTNFDQYDPDLLLAAVEGDLSPAQKRQIDQIRAADPRLAKLLDAMIADRRAMRELPDPTPPHWIMDEVDRQLERDMLVGVLPAEQQGQAMRQAHVLRRLMVYGAVAAMVAVVATVVFRSLPGGGPGDAGDLIAAKDPDKATPVSPRTESNDKAVATTDDAGDTTNTGVDKPVDPVKPDLTVAVDAPHPVDDGPKAIDTDDALGLLADAARDPEKLAALIDAPGPAPVESVDERLAKLYGQGSDAGDEVRPPLLPHDQSFSNQGDPRHMKLLPKLPPLSPKQNVEPTPDPSLVAPGSSLKLSTGDRAAAVKVIEKIIADHGGARTTDKPAGATIIYRVPAAKFNEIVGALRDALPISVVPADQAPKPAPDAAPWPAIVPNYTAILGQQLPAVASDAAGSEPTVDLPVTVTEKPTR